MDHGLGRHPFFARWTDPVSGVESFILTERVAPFQNALYFISPSISNDGRWLWFSAVFPPSHRRVLSAVCLDPATPRICILPAAALGGNPLLTPEGDSAFTPIEDGIYRVSVRGEITPVVRMPPEIIDNRQPFSLVTDLTLSADGRHFLLDSHIGNQWLISLAEVATGRITPLRSFFDCHHHAQFSPVAPDLMLIGQGPWHDPITGRKGNIDIRMWIMDRQQTRYEPVCADLWFNHNCMSCHEWWSADGMVCWVDYRDGVYECDLRDRRRTLVWPHVDLCHAQCDRAKRVYCADENPYHRSPRVPCRLLLFDRTTGREVVVASDMPGLPALPQEEWRSYHFDPHPHFSPDGRLVVYTTTVNGVLDVAVTPVEQAVARSERRRG